MTDYRIYHYTFVQYTTLSYNQGKLNIQHVFILVIDNQLRYISVKPTATVSVLRQKVWHLLDLPDYCEEIIILKSGDDREIPLTHLRRGNDPQHPYFLEVWMPSKHRNRE